MVQPAVSATRETARPEGALTALQGLNPLATLLPATDLDAAQLAAGAVRALSATPDQLAQALTSTDSATLKEAIATVLFRAGLAEETQSALLTGMVTGLSQRFEAGEITPTAYREASTAIAQSYPAILVTMLDPDKRTTLLQGVAWPYSGLAAAQIDHGAAVAIDGAIELVTGYRAEEEQQRTELATALAEDPELKELTTVALALPSGANLFAVGTRVAAIVQETYALPPTTVLPLADDTTTDGWSSFRTAEIRLQRDDQYWDSEGQTPGEKVEQMLDIALHEMRHQVQRTLSFAFMNELRGVDTGFSETALQQGRQFLLGRFCSQDESGFPEYLGSSLERDARSFAADILARRNASERV